MSEDSIIKPRLRFRYQNKSWVVNRTEGPWVYFHFDGETSNAHPECETLSLDCLRDLLGTGRARVIPMDESTADLDYIKQFDQVKIRIEQSRHDTLFHTNNRIDDLEEALKKAFDNLDQRLASISEGQKKILDQAPKEMKATMSSGQPQEPGIYSPSLVKRVEALSESEGFDLLLTRVANLEICQEKKTENPRLGVLERKCERLENKLRQTESDLVRQNDLRHTTDRLLEELIGRVRVLAEDSLVSKGNFSELHNRAIEHYENNSSNQLQLEPKPDE
jgi:hypothetical protein